MTIGPKQEAALEALEKTAYSKQIPEKYLTMESMLIELDAKIKKILADNPTNATEANQDDYEEINIEKLADECHEKTREIIELLEVAEKMKLERIKQVAAAIAERAKQEETTTGIKEKPDQQSPQNSISEMITKTVSDINKIVVAIRNQTFEIENELIKKTHNDIKNIDLATIKTIEAIKNLKTIQVMQILAKEKRKKTYAKLTSSVKPKERRIRDTKPTNECPKPRGRAYVQKIRRWAKEETQHKLPTLQ